MMRGSDGGDGSSGNTGNSNVKDNRNNINWDYLLVQYATVISLTVLCTKHIGHQRGYSTAKLWIQLCFRFQLKYSVFCILKYKHSCDINHHLQNCFLIDIINQYWDRYWFQQVSNETWDHFKLMILSYPFCKSHCGEKTVLRLFYPLNGDYCAGKTASLYGACCLLLLGKLWPINIRHT